MHLKKFIPAIIWLIVSFILLTLPGDDLPHAGLFNIPYFDKYVHLGMFFLLTALFALPFLYANLGVEQINRSILKIALYVIVYGIAMEFVQKYFTQGRSFDLVDIVFDAIGSTAGMIATRVFYMKKLVKKIGPDGNQGRNQN